MNSILRVAGLVALAVARAQTSSLPPPSELEQGQVLIHARDFAGNYELKLPSFSCERTTRRFENFNDQGWRLIEMFGERIKHLDLHEVYKAMAPNDRWIVADDQLHDGSFPEGFGSIMKTILQPETEAKFTWQDWSMLRGRLMYVYAYEVRAYQSSYHIETPGQSMDLASAYHGLIYVDREKHFVHRITLHPDGIPPTFPIQDVAITLDYDYRRIGDTDYLLPLQFEICSRQGGRTFRDEADYDDYREFSVFSIVALGLPRGR